MLFLLPALATPMAAPEITHSGRAHHVKWPSENVRLVLFDATVGAGLPTWQGLSPGDLVDRVDVYCTHNEVKGIRRCSGEPDKSPGTRHLESLNTRLAECLTARPVQPDPEFLSAVEDAWRAVEPIWLVDPEEVVKKTVSNGPLPGRTGQGPTRAVDHAALVVDRIDNPGNRFVVLHGTYIGHELVTTAADCGRRRPGDPPCLPYGVHVKGSKVRQQHAKAVLGPKNVGRGKHVSNRGVQPWSSDWTKVDVWNVHLYDKDERVWVDSLLSTLPELTEHARNATGPEAFGAWLRVAEMVVRQPGTPGLREAANALQELLPDGSDPFLVEGVERYRAIAAGEIPVGDPCSR